MASQFVSLPVTGGTGVTSLNTQTGALTLVAGSNISITPGSGTLTIAATGTGLGDINNGGNSFGSAISIGTNDNFGLSFKTNNATAATANTNAEWKFGANQTASTVHGFYKDIVAGGSTNSIALQIGNSGSSQGVGYLSFNNQIVTNSPSFDIAFSPRDNADTGTFIAGRISMIKGGTDNSGNMYFSTSDAAGTLNLGMTLTPAGDLELTAEHRLQFDDAVGGQYVAFKAPATVAGSTTYVLPDAPPASNKVLQSDSSSVLSWVDAIPGGTANTFAGFDSSGVLSTLPGWGVNVTTGGAQVYLLQNITVDNYNAQVSSFEAEINPTIATANVNYIGTNFDTHLDRTGSNQNMGGSITQINSTFTHEGNGSVNQLMVLNSFAGLGTGTSTGSGDIFRPLNFQSNVRSGYTLRQYQGMSLAFGIDAGGVLTEDVSQISLNTSGAITRNFDHIYSFTDAVVTGFERGIQFDLNGSVGQDLTVFSANVNTTVTNQFNGLNISMGGTSDQKNMLAISCNGNTTNTFNGLNINHNATANNVNLIVVSNNLDTTTDSKGVDIRIDGAAVNKTLFNAYSNSGAVQNWTGININAGGSATNAVSGLSVNLSGITSSVQKQGISVSDGSLQVNSNYDTSILPPSPGFIGLNGLGGSFHVAAGFPVTGTLVFGNNLGANAIFEDDMGPDGFGGFIGFSMNGFASQFTVAVGKTVDTFNFMLAGASVPTGVIPTDGGTVTNMSMFRAVGTLNAGGSVVVTNMYGFKADTQLSTYATNVWGVHVADTNADNWFAKNVVIGGVTEKPTGAFALDVTGDVKTSGDIASATLTPANGASGTFTTADAKTVTVTNGIITSIV